MSDLFLRNTSGGIVADLFQRPINHTQVTIPLGYPLRNNPTGIVQDLFLRTTLGGIVVPKQPKDDQPHPDHHRWTLSLRDNPTGIVGTIPHSCLTLT